MLRLRFSLPATVPTCNPLQAIWAALELGGVRRVRCSEGAAGLLDAEVLVRLLSLRVLNLSHCGLNSLPGIVGLLQVGGVGDRGWGVCHCHARLGMYKLSCCDGAVQA